MPNPWELMTREEGRAMDERKDSGPGRHRTAVYRETMWRIIQRHLPEDRGAPILDLAGGTGVWAIRLARQGHHVILSDISPGLLDRARDRIRPEGLADRVQIEQDDMCDLGRHEAEAFPLVLALGDPLSYCSDAARALREAYRVTRRHGTLIGDVENRYRCMLTGRRGATWQDAKRVLIDGVAHWPDPDNPYAIREFTPRELRDLLDQTGWSATEMYPSHVLASAVGDHAFEEVVASEGGLAAAADMEERLARDPSLLGCGPDIQFVVRKTG